MFTFSSVKNHISHVGVAISSTRWIRASQTCVSVKIGALPNGEKIQAAQIASGQQPGFGLMGTRQLEDLLPPGSDLRAHPTASEIAADLPQSLERRRVTIDQR